MSSKAMRHPLLLALCLLGPVGVACAGVTAEKTRVVFSAKNSEASLQVLNQNSYPVVMQTWVDDGEMSSTPDTTQAPIIPLPAIFRMEPGEQRNLRLIYSGEALPKDRESLFWLNLYEIPPRSNAPQSPDATRLTITLRTQMKVLFRPVQLQSAPHTINQQLQFTLQNTASTPTLRIDNPTPYFATLSTIKVKNGATDLAVQDGMIAPFAQQTLPFKQPGSIHSEAGAQVEFTRVDDEGNLIPGTAKLMQ